jgi:acetyl esterase/lipase
MTPLRLFHYRELYLHGDHRREDWQTSPNLAPKKVLAKAPRTWIAVAEFDLLAAEGMAYATGLQAVGVRAEAKTYQGATHSLFELNGMSRKLRE